MLTMNANRFQRSQYRLWSAHYGWAGAPGGEHICGPSTYKLTQTACDWTQFTNRALNSSLDESDLGSAAPSFTAPKPAPAATAAPAVTQAQALAALATVGAFVKAHPQ